MPAENGASHPPLNSQTFPSLARLQVGHFRFKSLKYPIYAPNISSRPPATEHFSVAGGREVFGVEYTPN